MKADLVVIGAGPAGLAAACSAKKAGVGNVLVVERDTEAGGILNQCIHSGFGLRYFKEELTGPEYAGRAVDMALAGGVDIMLDTMVLSASSKKVRAMSAGKGIFDIETKAVVLAMGCRERTRSAIAIPGTRPSGIMTAGLAQRYINIEGRMVGKRAVILGSGDIGLIMARRLVLEGAEVLACVEIMPFSSGLSRNIAQCLEDFGIPLLLSHTVTAIHGRGRLTGVTVSEVDESMRPVAGTEKKYDCDTLLLSVGLIPENELSAAAGIALDPRTRGPVVSDNNETGVQGIFACGNALHVHDLVDYVTEEGERAGEAAAGYVLGSSGEGPPERRQAEVVCGENVGYALPQKLCLDGGGEVKMFLRVKKPMKSGDIVVKCGGAEVLRIKRKYMAPGEMETVTLKRNAVSGTLTVFAEETE